MTDTFKNKLNLQWVSDVIGDDYKKWKPGEIILIESQTGTGKTYFTKNVLISNMPTHKRFLLVCNRTNLKRQLKKDLLTNYGMDIPETLEELDEITSINNVTVTSYHAIQNSSLDQTYNIGNCKMNDFDYIILDECHYIFTDSSFNNKTRIAYNELVRSYNYNSVKIFITATFDEIKQPIYTCSKKAVWGEKPLITEYSTGIDYSYIHTNYFNNIDDIVTMIKNDSSTDKWLVFISNLKDAKRIKKELGKIASLIKSGTTGDELNSIINNSKFEKKVLLATKALDNGINIDDSQLKHIVVMTWDKTTFIQMLGRKRVDINNADMVNLYIPTRYIKSFRSKLHTENDRKKEVDLYYSDINEFNRKYDNSLDKLGNLYDLFYKDKKTKDFKVNPLGNLRLIRNIEFSEYMIKKFENEGEYAFVTEQLSWLGLDHTFNEMNLIENVLSSESIESLENYLLNVVGKKIFKEEQEYLTKLVMSKFIQFKKKIDFRDYRTKKIQPTTLNKIFKNDLALPYAVEQKKEGSKKSEHYMERYWKIVKTVS